MSSTARRSLDAFCGIWAVIPFGRFTGDVAEVLRLADNCVNAALCADWRENEALCGVLRKSAWRDAAPKTPEIMIQT